MTQKINLKIYGVTTVGPKGQVIIPKDCRSDFKIEIGEEFEIVMVEKNAFGIGRKCDEDECSMDRKVKLIESQGFLNIGTKYQFVIPATIRKELNIEPSDSLVVIGKDCEGLGFIKNDNIEFLLEYIKEMTK